ncbi:MAG: 3-oxoacyl-[acyl-carrier-protein] reductase [bacterium]
MSYNFLNKIALVTGGTRGIGKSIAEKLLSSNATVIIAYNTSQKEAETMCRMAESEKKNLYAFKCDVGSSSEVKAMFNYIEKNFGRLDFLVNNAGIVKDGLTLKMTDEQWLGVINTDLNGVFYCTREALRLMLKQRYGRIVNISSIVGIKGNPGQANYAAAKAGIIGFSKSVAMEMGKKNILVNVVAPGYIETEMVSGVPEDFKRVILGKIAMGRYGNPYEVANVVCFLLSDDAGYINGAVVDIDGGMY